MFFGLNLGTMNAKNPIGLFKVPKRNQKSAKLKKNLCHFNDSFGSKGGRAKMLTLAKNSMNVLSLYKH